MVIVVFYNYSAHNFGTANCTQISSIVGIEMLILIGENFKWIWDAGMVVFLGHYQEKKKF
mgnify:CR=1 FL=1